MQRFALLAFGCVVALLLAEIVLSLGGLAPEVGAISIGRYRLSPNPKIRYEPIPDFEYDGEDLLYFEFRGRSNDLGFRDRVHSEQSIGDAFRILIIGDSISMGLSIDAYEDIYPVALERTLRDRGHDVEVINFGVAGYNTKQEVNMLIDKGLRFQPDLVLLQYCLNDTSEANGWIPERLHKQRKDRTGLDAAALDPILVRSATYRLLRYWVYPAIAQRRDRRSLRKNTVKESFALLRRIADKEGFDVLVVVFPQFGQLPERKFVKYDRVAGYSKDNAFRHLDLRAALGQCGELSKLSSDVFHPNREGHACAARAIAAYLENRVLVAAAP